MKCFKFSVSVAIVTLLSSSAVAPTFAQTVPEVFNNGNVIDSEYEIKKYEDQYFISTEDMDKLGLTLQHPTADKYILTSNDCFGIEKTLTIIKGYSIGTDFEIVPLPDLNLPTLTPSEDYTVYFDENGNIIFGSDEGNTETSNSASRLGSVTLEQRKTLKIGKETQAYHTNNIITDIGFSFNKTTIKSFDNKDFISLELIAQAFSHSYEITDEQISLNITTPDKLITDIEIYLADGFRLPEQGQEITVYAKAVDEQSSEIIASLPLTVTGKNKFIGCTLEIEAEKFRNKTLKIETDCGQRFDLSVAQEDFSTYGKIVFFPQLNSIVGTITVTSNQAFETDVPFTASTTTRNGNYSAQGILKSGTTSAQVSILIPEAVTSYSVDVTSDTDGYSIRQSDNLYLPPSYPSDFSRSFILTKTSESVRQLPLELSEVGNEITLKNTSSYDIDGYDMYIAAYDNDYTLLSIVKISDWIQKNTEKTLNHPFISDAVSYVKVFVWDNLNQKPLCNLLYME